MQGHESTATTAEDLRDFGFPEKGTPVSKPHLNLLASPLLGTRPANGPTIQNNTNGGVQKLPYVLPPALLFAGGTSKDTD